MVDDPAIAAAVQLVRGEWNVQTGSDLEVSQLTEKELLAAKSLPADAVVCSSHLLGVLAEQEWLAAVPSELLRGSDWTSLFDLPRLREATWGEQTMAVPFGSPLLCCYYRADLLKELGRRPPRTWDEYQELAELLAKKNPRPGDKNVPWCGTIEPLAPGWAGLTLLARAAPYLKNRNQFSALFDIETMEPQVDNPAMTQALTELVAAAKLGPADSTQYDPAAVRKAFWRGHCAMAITWPTAAKDRNNKKNEDEKPKGDGVPRVGFAELPGATKAYNISRQTWDNRTEGEDLQIPLLAVAGRLGVVNKSAGNTQAAFRLLVWLSDNRRGVQISATSPMTTMFRKSHVTMPASWVEKQVSADAAAQYGETTSAAFQHVSSLDALRIPGRAEYLAALDEAVIAAVRDKQKPSDVLKAASEKWRAITKRLGLERQRAAYRRSLGLGAE